VRDAPEQEKEVKKMKKIETIGGLTLLAALMLVSGVVLADDPWSSGGPIWEPELPDMHPCDYIDILIQCADGAPLSLFSLPREANKKKLLGELLSTRDECDLENLEGSLAKTLNDVIPNLSIWLVNSFIVHPNPDPVFQSACGYGLNFKEEMNEMMETMAALLVDVIGPGEWSHTVLYEGQSNYGMNLSYPFEQQYWTIEDQETWEQFWKVHCPTCPPPECPGVDFETERVVLAFLGKSNYGAHGIRVSDVFKVGDMDADPYIVVAVERTAPGGQYVLWFIDNPATFISTDLTLTDKPIIVLDEFSRNVIDVIY
jgi:hypothetical protein